MRRALPLLLALLWLTGCTRGELHTVDAASAACSIPADLTQAPVEVGAPDKVVADLTPDFYLLSLAWQPEACRSKSPDTSDPSACGGDFTWTLHGLWPNSADGKHPRYCRPSTPIPVALARKNYCMTPSVRLQQHEYAAHGTCAWDSPDAFFARERALWAGLKRPDLLALAGDQGALPAATLRDAFAAANPGLPREAVTIAVGPGNVLREVRLCHDLKFRPMACPGGNLGTPDAVMVRITGARANEG
jgi:ribonuclease T2